jgi:hypothetical protein
LYDANRQYTLTLHGLAGVDKQIEQSVLHSASPHLHIPDVFSAVHQALDVGMPHGCRWHKCGVVKARQSARLNACAKTADLDTQPQKCLWSQESDPADARDGCPVLGYG